MRLATLTLNDPSSTRHWLIWTDFSATRTISTIQKPINAHERLSMIQGDAAVLVCEGTAPATRSGASSWSSDPSVEQSQLN